MKKDPDWELARKWQDRAEDLEMRAAECDPEEQPHEHDLLTLEADTLRRCAIDLLAREQPKVSTEEEIKF